MAKRTRDDRQLGLFVEEPSVGGAENVSPAPARTEREWIVEQIVRDERVASGPEEYWEPSRQFYLDRAADYRRYLGTLQ